MLSMFKTNPLFVASNPPLELTHDDVDTVFMEYVPSSIPERAEEQKKATSARPVLTLVDKIAPNPTGFNKTDYERRDLHTRKLVDHALSIKTLAGKEGVKQAARYLAANKVDPSIATRVLLGPVTRRRNGDAR